MLFRSKWADLNVIFNFKFRWRKKRVWFLFDNIAHCGNSHLVPIFVENRFTHDSN